MSDFFQNNRGNEQATINLINDGMALNANNSRAFIILQNCGTAVAGISFSQSAPASLANCALRLYPATADGNGDGEMLFVNTSLAAMGVKFGATGTRNLQVTEYT